MAEEPSLGTTYPVVLGSSFLNGETPEYHTMLCKKKKKFRNFLFSCLCPV